MTETECRTPGCTLPAVRDGLCEWCAPPIRFELAQIQCEVGGWSNENAPPTPDQIKAAQDRWIGKAYEHAVRDEDDFIPQQCGGCAFFAATGMDFGLCWNEKSPMDGRITWEHGGCPQHSNLTKE